MMDNAEYATALIFAVEPSDRALAGWGGSSARWAAWTLRNAARWQERDNRWQAQRAADLADYRRTP